jgi:hypothetical protein
VPVRIITIFYSIAPSSVPSYRTELYRIFSSKNKVFELCTVDTQLIIVNNII